MKRTLIFGLGVLALGFMVRGNLQTTAQAKDTEWREKECRYQSLDKGLWTAREERLTAECATRKWSVPGGLSEFDAIAACESGWNRFANNAGRYVGLFQHAASAYVARIQQYDPPAWDRGLSTRWQNSRGQIVMSARMMHAVGTSPWSCA